MFNLMVQIVAVNKTDVICMVVLL